MFETSEAAEIAIPEVFQANGERVWAYVYRRLHVPWFHLRYLPPEQADGGVKLWLLAFLDNVSQLVDLQQAEGIEIDEVQVVLPPHLSRKRRWIMEPLAEIWEGMEPREHGHRVYVYALRNGKRYVDSVFARTEADLVDRRLIFRSSKEDE